MTPEAKIVRSIMEFANQYGKCIKLHGSAYMEKGTPDLLGGMAVGLHGGWNYTYVRFLVEVKVPGNKPTQLQLRRLKEWDHNGYATAWVTSLDEFKAFIEEASMYSQDIYPVGWYGPGREIWILE